jgi:uncharacterized coiled-coil DUF342 family protein
VRIASVDLDVVNVVERLRAEIRQTCATAAELHAVRDELKRDIADLRSEVRETFATKQELRETFMTKQEVRETFATKQELHAVRDELKRHSEVLFESVRGDMRVVAEGVAALSAKFDAR